MMRSGRPREEAGERRLMHVARDVFTLFPDMFPGPLGLSLAGDALARGVWASRRTTSARTGSAAIAPSTTRRPAAAPAW